VIHPMLVVVVALAVVGLTGAILYFIAGRKEKE